MHYDITLKQLFHNTPTRLLKILTGRKAVETLNVEYPSVKKRLPDLVLRLDDGGIYHLEIQNAGNSKMPWRMLEYYSLIRQHYNGSLRQQVLYVGLGATRKARIVAWMEPGRCPLVHQPLDFAALVSGSPRHGQGPAESGESSSVYATFRYATSRLRSCRNG